MDFLVGAILPPVTLLLFFGGLIYRIRQWRALPSPPITLTPAPETTGGRLAEILQDSFLFRRLFRGDPTLWFVALLFHLTLAISLFAHYDRILALMGFTPGGTFSRPPLSGGFTGICMLLCAAGLLLRRLVVKRVAEISTLDDYVALFLILAVAATGDMLRYQAHFDVIQAREYFTGLRSLTYRGFPQSTWFLAHYFLAQILIIYVPFSKVMHLGGLFFTQAAVHKH